MTLNNSYKKQRKVHFEIMIIQNLSNIYILVIIKNQKINLIKIKGNVKILGQLTRITLNFLINMEFQILIIKNVEKEYSKS